MNAHKPRRRWFQFRLRTLLIAVVVLGMAGACVAREANSVHTRPSWFAIGPEVYQEMDVAEAEKQVLSVRLEPRWFVGCDKVVSKAEFGAHFAGPGVSEQVQVDGRYSVSDTPPYPKQVVDLPLEDHGVTLGLDASAGVDPTIVSLELKLESKDMPIHRQVEHRWTNTLPFLFAFWVDGQPVTVPATSFNKEGGMAWMTPLVEKGGARRWSVKVNAESLRALLPDACPHSLSVAAAFANTQHEGDFEDSEMLRDGCDNAEPQILVRSGFSRLRWDGTKWEGFDR